MASSDDVDMTTRKDNFLRVHVCTPCELSDGVRLEAEGYCLNCREYLCEKCYRYHCIPSATKKHVLVKGSNMPDLQIVKTIDKCEEVCSDHKDLLLEYFCRTCKEVGCSECMETGHVRCAGVSTVQDYLKDNPGWNDNRMYMWNYGSSKCPDESMQKIKDKIERYKFGVELKGNEIRGQFKEFREKAIEALDELENFIDNKINTYCNEELSTLGVLMKRCDTIQEKFEKMENKIVKSRKSKCNCFVNTKVKEKEVKMFNESNEVENLQKELRLRSFEFQPTFRDVVEEKNNSR